MELQAVWGRGLAVEGGVLCRYAGLWPEYSNLVDSQIAAESRGSRGGVAG